MKIFLSWSTEPSKYIAAALKEWIPIVIQAAHPWFSPNDIERGARWSTEIAVQLEESKFGILCITPENLNAPWINFEAGALAKTLTKTYVVPLLYNLDPADLVGPLSQFNAARLNKEEVHKLLHTINKSLDVPLNTDVINQSFEMWWPQLDEKLKSVPKIEAKKVNKRTDRDILEEVLTLLRSQQKLRIPTRVLESNEREVVEGMLVDFSSNLDVFKGGKIVFSHKFGRGKILAITGTGDKQEAMIAFDDGVGTKKLLLKYANLGIVASENVFSGLDIDETPFE